MIPAIVAWLLAALTCILFFRRVLYSALDPLVVVATVSITFSAALLAVLCTAQLVSWDKMELFSVVLLGYLAGARTVGAWFRREAFRRTIIGAVSAIRRREIVTILMITAFLTLILGLLGIEMGAAGDARQRFDKLFRPLVLLDNGLFLVSLVLLLSSKLSRSQVAAWLVVLVVLSVPFSGKSILLPVAYWYGLKLFLERRKLTVRGAMTWGVVVVLGGSVMALLAYGATDFFRSFLVLTHRIWMSGDIYIYAYRSDTLNAIRDHYHVSFLGYMLHPITSIFGVRGYDKPLGSTIASELAGTDVLTGPNPQLPVVLDYFFPDQPAACGLIAFLIGFLVVGLRPLGIVLARSRSRFVRIGGIVAAIMCPAGGFLDTSLVWMTLVGVAAAALLAAALEMMFARHHGAAGGDGLKRVPPPLRPTGTAVHTGVTSP